MAHVAEESNEATIQKLAGRIKYALRIAFGRAAAERLTDCATPSLFCQRNKLDLHELLFDISVDESTHCNGL